MRMAMTQANHNTRFNLAPSTMRAGQEGVFLLEALIAILIFSIGILGIVALGATAVNAQNDAQYRSEAARAADNIVSAMWMSIDRGQSSAGPIVRPDQRQAIIAASMAQFVHQPAGAPERCEFTGAQTTNAAVLATIADLTTGVRALPGTTARRVQVDVRPVPVGSDQNEVWVTICWQTPNDAVPRVHTLITVVN
jgi:type IV pilus assembly protein PilV